MNKEDYLLKNKEDIMLWIENCDNKASIMLALIGVILSIFITSDKFNLLKKMVTKPISNTFISFIYLITTLGAFICIIISVFNFLNSLQATTELEKKTKRSLIYFGSISKTYMSGDEYLEEINLQDKKSYLEDLANQIVINSRICNNKFRYYNRGIKFTQYALLGGILSLLLEFFI